MVGSLVGRSTRSGSASSSAMTSSHQTLISAPAQTPYGFGGIGATFLPGSPLFTHDHQPWGARISN